ncbi:hypothetical protein ACJRO7_033360 [Eucalyptus globulus]|uniref:Major facilitator superfamily (MFS) profile domain-containing protein n=1 Tax=Eucalyptus globulus TaxID=34317 RepID=A0ABD3JRA1_EUCGL
MNCTYILGVGLMSIIDHSCLPRFGHVNYEDPHFNVGLPVVFSIHGNHDDPAGVVCDEWPNARFDNFLHVAISRGLNGIGLAIVIPAVLSLVADSTDDSNRGMAFGWLQLTGNIGSIIGSLCSVLIASTSFLGIPSWRIAFHLVAIVSVVVGILVWLFAIDPRHSDDKTQAEDLNSKQCSALITEVGKRAGCPLRESNWMGDVLAKRLPNSGRIILSQISTASAISLAAILLLALPDDPSTAFMHGLVLFIMGLCTSWCAPATNNPIFAEIVPEKSRTSIYALDNSFESILASFAPPLVGILAQHIYGYKPIPEGSSDSIEIETDRENAASLAKALYAAMGIPMAICCFIYSFLYCTYWRDREHARMDAITEMQQIEVDSPYTGKDITDLDASIANGAYEKARSTIDRDYGTEEWVDLDDNDEKSLLSRQQTLTDIGE